MTNTETYNYKVVRQFSIMTIVWGIVGMSVGVLIASQLAWPALNFDIPWLTYSFVESVQAMHPYYIIRMLGGACFLLGTLVMAYNLWKTIAGAKPVTVEIPEPATAH